MQNPSVMSRRIFLGVFNKYVLGGVARDVRFRALGCGQGCVCW